MMRIDLDLLTFVILLSSMLLITYLMVLISNKLGKDMKKCPTDGSLIIAWVKDSAGLRVTGPIIVQCHQHMMITTVSAIKVNEEDVIRWIPLGHDMYFNGKYIGISKKGPNSTSK